MWRGRAGAGGGSVNPLPVWGARAGPRLGCAVPGAPAGRAEVPELPKGTVGPVWGFGSFLLWLFFSWVTAELRWVVRRGRTEGGCGEGVMLGWTWLGAHPASPASQGGCSGTARRSGAGSALAGVPRAGGGAGACPLLPAGVSSCAARCGHAPREAVGGDVVALWLVHAVRDFNELPCGTIRVCLHSTGVVETACAATTGSTRRAFAVALGFFLRHVLLCGSCAAWKAKWGGCVVPAVPSACQALPAHRAL